MFTTDIVNALLGMKRTNLVHVFFIHDNPENVLSFLLPLTDVTLIRIKPTIFLHKTFSSSSIHSDGHE